MPSTPWKFAQTATGFVNPGNISANDDVMATVGSLDAGWYSNYLIAKNFGFTTTDVPSGATITGLEFRIRWKHVSRPTFYISMASVRFSWGGSDGNKSASFPPITNVFNQFVIGGTADLWGAGTLMAAGADAEVRHAEFGLILRGYNSDPKYSFEGGFDGIEMRVTYAGAAPAAPVVTNGSASGTYGTSGTAQMAATETPTSWSLPGSPPAGLSISSSGLVSWTSAVPVGVYSITTRATNGTGSGDGTLTLTIGRAPLTVTANNKSRVVGAANPTFDGVIAGFVNGETAAVLTTQPTYVCVADTNTPVGTVAITASGAAADNYSFSYIDGTLTITIPTPVVTAATLTRAYGTGGTVQMVATNTPTAWSLPGNPPAGLSINSAGLLTVAAGTAVQAGSVQVAATNAGGSGTGTLTLTITPVTLTVTASNKTRFVGDNNPALSGVITGFVNGETTAALAGSASYTCSADATAAIGTYPIVAAVGTLASNNYQFSFVNGVLYVIDQIRPVAVSLGNPAADAVPATAAEILTRAAVVRGATGVPPELRAVYDALMGPTSDAAGLAARATAFAHVLQDPRYAPLVATSAAPISPPGVYLTGVPGNAVVGVDAPASALVAYDGRAEIRTTLSISAAGRYQIAGVPSVYVVVHSMVAPFTVDVLVRRAAVLTGCIGPGGDSTTARLTALLTPAVCNVLFGAHPSGVYADAATLAESSRATDRLAGVLVALVRRIAALR